MSVSFARNQTASFRLSRSPDSLADWPTVRLPDIIKDNFAAGRQMGIDTNWRLRALTKLHLLGRFVVKVSVANGVSNGRHCVLLSSVEARSRLPLSRRRRLASATLLRSLCSSAGWTDELDLKAPKTLQLAPYHGNSSAALSLLASLVRDAQFEYKSRLDVSSL